MAIDNIYTWSYGYAGPNTGYTADNNCLKKAGISSISLMDFAYLTNDYRTNSSDSISAITYVSSASFDFLSIELWPEASSYSQNQVFDQQTGSNHYEQTLSFTMVGNDANNRRRVLQMINSIQLVALVKDNRGKTFLFGKDNGLRCTSSQENSGAGFTDFNGINITLSGLEKNKAYVVIDNYTKIN